MQNIAFLKKTVRVNFGGETEPTDGSPHDTHSAGWAPGADYNVFTEKWYPTEVQFYRNGPFWVTHNEAISTEAYNVNLEIWNAYSNNGPALEVDWYAVRRAVDPEPSTALSMAESSKKYLKFEGVVLEGVLLE